MISRLPEPVGIDKRNLCRIVNSQNIKESVMDGWRKFVENRVGDSAMKIRSTLMSLFLVVGGTGGVPQASGLNLSKGKTRTSLTQTRNGDQHKLQRVLQKANDMMRHPGRYTNPNTGNHVWDHYCLGFVNAVTGRRDSALLQPTAMQAMLAMVRSRRARRDFPNMPPGAVAFWGMPPNGHAAIYSGRRNRNGERLYFSTTGWGGLTGIHLVTAGYISRAHPPRYWAVPMA